jgi:hypothetical protein
LTYIFLETIVIELAVIRDVGCNTPFSDHLYSWLANVAKEACDLRRNVRVSISNLPIPIL